MPFARLTTFKKDIYRDIVQQLRTYISRLTLIFAIIRGGKIEEKTTIFL